MTIQELKSTIELGEFTYKTLIFKCSDNTFLAEQYLNEIINILNLEPIYIDNLEEIQNNNGFFDIGNNALYVMRCDKLNHIINQNDNFLIIITNDIHKNIESEFQNIIVETPKLENWQIRDYVYSNLEGIKPQYIDWLLDNTKYNIYRLQTEIDKLNIFNPKEKNIVFQKMLDDNAFDDITKYDIWDFINCITNKNTSELSNIYEDINNIEIDPMGLLNLIYQSFRKLILVWMNRNPIPDNTGLTTKQIYAINKLPRVWTGDQLIDILKFITELDFKIKTGQIPIDYLRDYIVINILSR